MPALYDKPTRLLMRDMVDSLGIEEGDVFSRNDVRSWFHKHYPKIKDGTISAHLLRLSINAPSRVYYNAKQGEDDLFFQIDSQRFRLYEPQNDPAPIYDEVAPESIEAETENNIEASSNEFAYEKDLQNFLAKNLYVIEEGLSLYQDEEISGIEYPVGGRYIDILATDSENNWVVIELKVSKGYDRVIGQLLRYMAWIRKHHAEPGQKVRGIIVARNISPDLQMACSEIPGISLYEYRLSVAVQKIDPLSSDS